MKYLAVKNFEEHQHYRDRIPPWIKFYNRVLDDYGFIQLSGAARSHLMLIWLLASRHKNRIPFDLKYITGAIHARERVDLDALIGAGWLAIVEDAASTVASTGASKVASEIGDVEREREREKEKKEPPTAVAKAPKEPAPWMGRFGTAWREQYDGTMPGGPSVGPLRRLIKKHSEDETFRRWVIYLAATEGRFASAAKFEATWGDWSGVAKAVVVRPAGDPVGDAAWETVIRMVPAWHRRESDFAQRMGDLPPRVRAGISAVGGFRRIADTPDDKRWTLKRDFAVAYHAPTEQKVPA